MTQSELLGRLERVERDNRRLKRCGLALLAFLVALTAVYATRPVPQKITAHEFDVVDSSGRVRIKLSTTPASTSVEVVDAQGQRAASMEEDYLGASFITAGKDGGEVAALSNTPWLGASVGVAYSPVVALKAGKGLRDAMKSYVAQLKSEPSVGMGVSPSGAVNIRLQDAQGFSTDIGNTGTVIKATGATQETSAASIVMFGNDKQHHVIWQAP